MAYSVADKLDSIRDIVAYWLKADPKYRDNDEKLVSRIWFQELVNLKKIPKDISAREFLILYCEGKLTQAESIMRVRRKLQEEREDLRGEKYLERQLQEKKVRKNMKKPRYFDEPQTDKDESF